MDKLQFLVLIFIIGLDVGCCSCKVFTSGIEHSYPSLDRFSRFSTARGYVQQTDRQTDRQTTLHRWQYVASLHCVYAMRPNKRETMCVCGKVAVKRRCQ